jgi:hypothetical protein
LRASEGVATFQPVAKSLANFMKKVETKRFQMPGLDLGSPESATIIVGKLDPDIVNVSVL